VEIDHRSKEIIRDHLKECVEHLARRFNETFPKGKKGISRFRKPMADFCGVGDTTIASWLSDVGHRLPMGEIEVKLKCFLDLNGYRVIELERLPRAIRNFAELIGFGLLTTDRAAELLGFARGSTLYPVLSQEGRDTTLSREKQAKMFDVWKGMKDELEHKKKEALRLYRLGFLDHAVARPSEQPLLSPAIVNGTVASRRTAVLSILKGVLALLEDGLFDELSESEIAILKENHGSDILRLSARLSTMSSKLISGKQGN
jgi:hypothetical protein